MVTSLTVTSGKTKCAVSRQNANRGRPLGDDSGKIRGSWAIVRRIGDHYVDRVSVIEAERITQPDSGRDLDDRGSMVPFATSFLSVRRMKASTSSMRQGTMLRPTA